MNLIASLDGNSAWRECPLIAGIKPKQEKSLMNHHDVLYIGIDVSKLKHDLAVMNEQKKLLCKTFVIRENRTGYSLLAQRLEQLRDRYQTQSTKPNPIG